MVETTNAVVHRFEEAFAANDVAAIDELTDPNLIDHNPIPEQRPGRDGFKETIALYKSVFPDMEVSDVQVISEGDYAATRWKVSGTHQADFFGVPATGKRVTVEGMNFYRLEDGKITEVWTQFDGVAMMQQLGAIPE